MRLGFKTAIVGGLVAVFTFLLIPDLGSPTYAHRNGRYHRHHRARKVLVVGAPVKLARPVIVAGRAHGVIDLNVKPKTTEVYVDGTLRGQVDDFDGHPGKLRLLPGKHKLKLVTPAGEEYERKIKVVAGHEINLKLDLEKD